MRAKEYLMGYIRARTEIRRLSEIRKELKANAERLSGDMTAERVQSSKLNDQMATVVAKLADNLEEIMKAELDAQRRLADILKTIGKTTPGRRRQVLTLRYTVLGSNGKQMTWQEIADIALVSEREAFRLHRSGLLEIEKIIR